MKKTVLCVIAHPDDEAFGPSGTLAILSRSYDVHLVCVTDGASDSRFHPLGASLAPIRAEELRHSANVLGIKEVHFLNYKDGSLNNNLYHEVAEKLQFVVDKIKPSLLITNELRGISGHLDHVAVGMITSFVFRKSPEIDAIWYTVASKYASDTMQDYFVFFPPGYEKEKVDKVVDIADVFEKKMAAAACHESQGKDVLRVTTRWKETPKEEWFLVTARRDVPLTALTSPEPA
jgi:LmbE family N-acetylglucosaminyl deacetylase